MLDLVTVANEFVGVNTQKMLVFMLKVLAMHSIMKVYCSHDSI